MTDHKDEPQAMTLTEGIGEANQEATMPEPLVAIDHYLTDGVVCPHCGYDHGDDPEWIPRQLVDYHDCYECGKRFQVEADFEVRFITEKVDRRADPRAALAAVGEGEA